MEGYAADSNYMHDYKMKNSIFVKKDFISHSSKQLQWKIDCDALSDEDVETCAWLIAQKIKFFGSVIGIPTGGTRLAYALQKYTSYYMRDDRILIVDDVLTIGESMGKEFDIISKKYPNSIIAGAVIFARSIPQTWITPLFQCCV
jgi:hypothetical protein